MQNLDMDYNKGIRYKEQYRQNISLVKIKASFMCSWIKQVVGNS